MNQEEQSTVNENTELVVVDENTQLEETHSDDEIELQNDDTALEVVDDSDEDDDQGMEFARNHKHFVISVVSVMDLLKDKSESLMESAESKKKKQHLKLQQSCSKILDQYRTDVDNLNEGKIIKKVYKTLRDNIELLKDKNGDLFSVRDNKNKIVTIIPGINIKLIYGHFDEKESEMFWQYMYLLFISSVKLITQSNDDNKMKTGRNKIVSDNMEEMEKELMKTGLTVKGSAFNPFIGLKGASKQAFGVDALFSGEAPQTGVGGDLLPGMDMNMVLSQLGIDTMVDMDKINEQLKNISEKEITSATKNITQILGAEEGSDVADVCDTLVRSIVDNLKEKGISDMMGTLKSISESVDKNIDKEKMKKTAKTMQGFMMNSEQRLKEMKDEKGNPIGDKLFNAMSGPLNMAKNMSEGKMPDISAMASMMGLTGALNGDLEKKSDGEQREQKTITNNEEKKSSNTSNKKSKKKSRKSKNSKKKR